MTSFSRLLTPFALLALTACSSLVEPTRGPNAILVREAEDRVAELQYQHGSELLNNLYQLRAMMDRTPDAIRAGLESPDAHTRANVIYVLEMTDDRRNIPYIQPLLADPSPKVRYQAASTLVEMGDPDGFSVLVEGLADTNIRYRYKCFEALRDATGKDFGYLHDSDPDSRRVAVTRWLDWLEDVQARAL